MTLTRITQILAQHGIEWIEQDGAIAALEILSVDGRTVGQWQIFGWSTTWGELAHWLGY